MEMSIEEIRKHQLDMLDYFVDICKKNNLKYSLAGGTLIGALRHSGYIPWDDDIDVIMPRPDYEKLMRIKEKENNKKYVIKSPYDTKIEPIPYPYTYAKIYDLRTELVEMPNTKKIKSHIYIDIFCMDGLPTDVNTFDKYYKSISNLKRIYRILSIAKYNQQYKRGINKLIWLVVYYTSIIITPKKILSILEKKLLKYNYDESEYIGCMIAGYGKRERISKDAFTEIVDIQFEKREYKAMRGYDEYLTNLYGNYMKFPPKEKRVRAHDYIAIFK